MPHPITDAVASDQADLKTAGGRAEADEHVVAQ